VKKNNFAELCLLSCEKGALKKLVLSRPKESEITKITGRLCEHKRGKLLALEFSLPGNTVSHKNIPLSTLLEELFPLLDGYGQANLITTLGDAEYKISKKGKEALLGGDALLQRLDSEISPEDAIQALDKSKHRILDGSERFLIKLGVSDKNGRVHDKKQGKFRQINRFLEHIETLYDELPLDRDIIIYDLCCGKSYLSFAVYHYLTEIKGRRVSLLGIDLKHDVISWCQELARSLGFVGMKFVCDDVTNTPKGVTPDMVISLHACDVATDIVINTAINLKAKVILSTPCCHRYMNGKVKAKELSFVTDYPHLAGKLCEALTDAVRAKRLEANGYKVTVPELTDPENTPKNTLIRAIRCESATSESLNGARLEYERILKFILGDGYENYLSEICK